MSIEILNVTVSLAGGTGKPARISISQSRTDEDGMVEYFDVMLSPLQIPLLKQQLDIIMQDLREVEE